MVDRRFCAMTVTEEMALILSAWASLWFVVHADMLFCTGYKQVPVFRAECSKFWKPYLHFEMAIENEPTFAVSLLDFSFFRTLGSVFCVWVLIFFASTAAGCFILRCCSLLTETVIGADTLRRLLRTSPILVGQRRTPVFLGTVHCSPGLFVYVLHCKDYAIARNVAITIADHLQ